MLEPGQTVRIGPSGRKIIYDADGKPYVYNNLYHIHRFQKKNN